MFGVGAWVIPPDLLARRIPPDMFAGQANAAVKTAQAKATAKAKAATKTAKAKAMLKNKDQLLALHCENVFLVFREPFFLANYSLPALLQ